MQSVEELETLKKVVVKVFPNWGHPKWGGSVRDYQTTHGDNKFLPFTEFINLSTLPRCNACLFLLTWTQDLQQEIHEQRLQKNKGMP